MRESHKYEHKRSKQIGGKLAVKFALIGAFIAMLIMSILHSTKGVNHLFDWAFKFSPPILFGFVGLILGSLIFGRIAGKMIQTKKNVDITGIILALSVMWFAVIAASASMVLAELYEGEFGLSDLLKFYLLRPIYWITIIGFAPAMILGIWFGRLLELRLKCS